MPPFIGDASASVNKIVQDLYLNNFKIQPTFDGKLHRFDRLKKNSGWYVSHVVRTRSSKEYPLVVCGDWVSGEQFKFYENEVEPNDQQEVKAVIEKAMQENGRLKKEKQDFAISLAADEWEVAEPSTLSAYMHRKGFSGNFGGRVTKEGVLLIPTYAEGVMYGLERIYPDGTKRYLGGQRMKGCFYTIGQPSINTTTYLCEGFATGCSINAATGMPVIVAFSASNMVDVAKSFVGYKIITAGDNDRFTEGNPGVTAAQKCSAFLGTKPIIPIFPQGDKDGTDFNDLHMRYGIDAAREQLEVKVNVVPITAKAVKVPKKKMSEIYRSIADAMLGKNLDPVPDFPVRFHIIEPSRGTRLIVQEEDDEIVKYVSDKAVTQTILQYVHNLYLIRTKENIGFEQKHAAECMKFWRDFVTPISIPKMVSWPGEEGYTMRRLPWPMEFGPTPLFDEMFNRTSNSYALMCFIGSLFDPLADRQQYVWLYGQGQNGKGALSRFLRKALGNSYSAQTVPGQGDRFWTSGLLGARLVVFPDCNNSSFAASGLFKNLTGDDPVRIEQKGQMPFTTELSAKYMYLSNNRPDLSSEIADIRRCIFCDMQAISAYDPYYEANLWEEGGSFLGKCIAAYDNAYGKTHSQIGTDEDSGLSDWVSTLEEEFESVFSRNFELSREELAPIRFQEQLEKVWPGARRKQLDFRAWLERKHGIKKISKRGVDAVIKIYKGISIQRFGNVAF